MREAIERLGETAVSDANLMPAVMHAVEKWVTVGEISDTLRRAYGAYEENVVC